MNETKTISKAARAQRAAELKQLTLAAHAVAQELKTINANERNALKTLSRLVSDLQKEGRNIAKRQKALQRECNAARKAAQARAGKIDARIAIVKGRAQ